MSHRGRDRFRDFGRHEPTYISFASESSREPSREPTPVVALEPKRKRRWCTRFLTSSIIFVFVLAFAIVSSVYSMSNLRKCYCISKDEDNGCVTCPENAICTRTRFTCIEGYKKRYRYCVIPGSDEDIALNCVREVTDALHRRAFRTIRDLSSEVNCRFLELAVNMTEEYQVNRGEIQLVDDLSMQRRKEQFMIALPFFFWILLLYLIYARQ